MEPLEEALDKAQATLIRVASERIRSIEEQIATLKSIGGADAEKEVALLLEKRGEWQAIKERAEAP